MSSDFIVGFKYKIIQVYCQKYTKNGVLSVVFKYKIDSIFVMMSIHHSDKIFCESNISLLQEHLTHTKKSRCMLAISMLLTPGTFLMSQGAVRDFWKLRIAWEYDGLRDFRESRECLKKKKWNKKIIAKILFFFFFFQHPPQSPWTP